LAAFNQVIGTIPKVRLSNSLRYLIFPCPPIVNRGQAGSEFNQREHGLELIALGALLMVGDLPQGRGMQIVWAIPTGLIWIFVLGCAVAAWIVGYGMGYRKGTRDAIRDTILKAAPALDGE